jgi:hypothetical protein
MPFLAKGLDAEVNRALALAQAGEAARARLLGTTSSGELSLFRLRLMYEMAYLHIFVNWESFLEESFVRYLCGYRSGTGRATLVSGAYARDIASARGLLLRGRRFLLWHGPKTVTDRSMRYFRLGNHETVIDSNFARMEWFAAIRHYIAHKHADARQAFDDACLNLAGRRFPGSRPGAFLRADLVVSGVKTRWLAVIGTELASLARQIVP